MRNAGQHVTRAQIIEHVWNLSFDTMLAFFVVLYSSAQIDQPKARQLAMAIQVAFQQMGPSMLPAPRLRWPAPNPGLSRTWRLSKVSNVFKPWAACPLHRKARSLARSIAPR
jgi:hypothetical protein